MHAIQTSRIVSISISVLQHNLNIINFIELIRNDFEDFENVLCKKDTESMFEHLTIDQKRVLDKVIGCLEQYIKDWNTCTSYYPV